MATSDGRLAMPALADWLGHIPSRLGSDEVLDRTAAVFLGAFEGLHRRDSHLSEFKNIYEMATGALNAHRKDLSQSTHSSLLLASMAMMQTAYVS